MPFKISTEWTYVRETTAGDLSHTVAEKRTNPHVLSYKGLFTDRSLYHPGEVVCLFGVIVPGNPERIRRCNAYHCVALLTPTKVDRLFPVVLREAGRHFGQALGELGKILEALGAEQGSRMILACDDLEHVAVVPGGFFAPAA